VGVAWAEAGAGGSGSVAGSVAAVAEFGDTDSDGDGAAEDLLDGVGAVRPGCLAGEQVEGLLGVADQFGQVGVRRSGSLQMIRLPG
jgi:hypothetical protein